MAAAAAPAFGSPPAAAAAAAAAAGASQSNGAATVAAAMDSSDRGGVATPGLPKIVLKAVLLGNSGVGKTCLLNRYVDNTYVGAGGYKATIGSDFKLKELVVDGQPVTLQIWDTAGQERFASLGDLFHRGANMCLLVFDLTKTDSFEALQQWKDEFLASSAMHGLDDGAAASSAADFPFACVANKVDRHAERTVSQKRAAKWCTAGGSDMSYFETSAKDATNVAQCFNQMTRRALKFQAESQASVSKLMDKSNTVVLEQRKREQSTGCCS